MARVVSSNRTPWCAQIKCYICKSLVEFEAEDLWIENGYVWGRCPDCQSSISLPNTPPNKIYQMLRKY